jgi:hypothetical protein
MCDFSTWALPRVGCFKGAPHGRACRDPRHQGDPIRSLAASVPPDCGSDAPASPAAVFAAEMNAQALQPQGPLKERTQRGPGAGHITQGAKRPSSGFCAEMSYAEH